MTPDAPDGAHPGPGAAEDLLAHHYQRVDADQVWTVAVGEIPRLAASLRGHPGMASP